MKILDYKMNAVMAKARALYGQRLTGEDYNNLVSCRSMGEFVTYLKNRTSYADMLRGVSTTDPEADLIEFLIRKKAYLQFSALCHYEMTLGEDFSNYFIIKEEIKQILACLKSILFHNTDKYVMKMPGFYERSLHFDVRNLMRVRSLEELSQTLSGTPYKKIIDEGIKKQDSYLEFECAFINYFDEYEYKLINKNLGRSDRKELLSLLEQKADLQFIDKIYRLKKYFPENKTTVSIVAPSKLTAFSKKQIKAFINAEDEKEVTQLLKKTGYKNYAYEMENSPYIEQAIDRIHYKKHKRLLRFSTNPNTVMFCFMFLAENEVNNLIHITEGIKYNLAPEHIQSLLIGVGD